MKSYQTGLVVLAAAGYSAALAAPAVTAAARLAERSSTPKSAPHTADHAPAVNPSYKFAEDAAEDVSQVCIDFTSSNPDWGYTNSNPWSGSGTFGSSSTICVPTSNSAGGAMYIGPSSNPGAGSTKLECFFPTSGTANCDISLVDGYSLSVTCQADGMQIGGPTDLWSTGQTCVDESEISSGICKNDEGYASSQSDVTGFFQAGINNGNNYCIWVNCSQDYYFPVTSSISCSVTGTGES